jgi:hypothetical protein
MVNSLIRINVVAVEVKFGVKLVETGIWRTTPFVMYLPVDRGGNTGLKIRDLDRGMAVFLDSFLLAGHIAAPQCRA